MNAEEGGIQLTSIAEEDVHTLFEWINDRTLVLSSSAFSPVHEADHLEWFEKVRKQKDTRIFAIRHETDGRLIGTCQLHSINPIHQSAELQIRLGDAADRGHGYGTKAVAALIRFGFKDLNLHRIYLHVLANNTAAINIYEKNGFHTEGQLRDAVYIDGNWHDIVVMGLLRNEASTE